jgi:HSP20 family protein
MDVTRTDGELIVTAELPGIDPYKDVEITVDEDYLTVKGEKSQEKEVSEEDRYMHERKYGKFVRRVPVPEGVSADKIAANYAKGILTVKVTLPEETKPAEPEKIKVEVEAG